MRVFGLWVMALSPALAQDAPSSTPVPAMGQMPDAIRNVAVGVMNEPRSARVDAISSAMLDRPYVNDPLGEGVPPDTDPLVRYDAFDCLTYVEEVLALSLAPDPRHAADVRLSLRYGDNPPEYRYRHHFMELQWIPSAVDKGWLRETTHEYGPIQTYTRDVTAATWSAWRSRASFSLTDEELPYGTMVLNYLSLEDALAAVDDIRPGSVVMTVRDDRSYNPLWISHVSFVVPGDRPTIRHASRMSSVMETRDQGLRWYIEQLMSYKNWKAVGLAIYEPVENGPRRITVEEP
jgi:hypothetical protein